MELDLFNTLVGPLLFAMIAGTWGFFNRPEKRSALLHALVLMFVTCAVLYAFYPSTSLFGVLLMDGLLLSGLYGLFVRHAVVRR